MLYKDRKTHRRQYKPCLWEDVSYFATRSRPNMTSAQREWLTSHVVPFADRVPAITIAILVRADTRCFRDGKAAGNPADIFSAGGKPDGVVVTLVGSHETLMYRITNEGFLEQSLALRRSALAMESLVRAT